MKQDYVLLNKEMNAIKAALAAFSRAYGKLGQNAPKRSASPRAKLAAAAQRARLATAQGNVVTMPK
jgi:hypothetical protein